MDFPDDLVIPPPLKTTPMDVDEWDPVRLFLRRGQLYAETKRNTWNIWRQKDLIALFGKTKHSFTIAPPGLFDALLQGFRRTDIFMLDLGAEIKLEKRAFSYRGNYIKLREGRTTKILWNLWSFFLLDEEPDSLDKIDAYCSLLIHYLDKHGIVFSDLASSPSVARRLLLEHAFPEFVSATSEKLVLERFYRSGHGGRQESTGLGLIDSWNYDIRKAHLGLLDNLPSIRGTQHRRDFPYVEEAVYGCYLIEAEIPKMSLCPLPVAVEGQYEVEIYHPYGNISGWYAKPYIDLLLELKIPFRVFESEQFLPIKEATYPFRPVARKIRNYMNDVPPYISGKSLYHGIAGSTISWRRVVDLDTGNIYPRAFGVFNPIIYATILAKQSVRVWKEAHRSDPIAIRSDAVTVGRKMATGMGFEDHGPMIFLTPMFKTFPSGRGDLWRHLIEYYRDRSYVLYFRSDFPTVRTFLNTGLMLGKIHERSTMIRPTHGRRKGEIPKKVGDLLYKWFPSEPLSL